MISGWDFFKHYGMIMISYCINKQIINKMQDSKLQSKILTEKFTRETTELKQLLEYVKEGYAFCIADMVENAVTNYCYRKSESFISGQMIVVDIDNKDKDGNRVSDEEYITWEELQQKMEIKTYASFIYTTPNHREDWHRMRIVFELPKKIENSNDISRLQKFFAERYRGDLQATSCVQAFFGSKDCEYVFYGNTLNDTMVEMILEQEESIQKEEYKYRFNANPEYDVTGKDIKGMLDKIPFLNNQGNFELDYLDWVRVISAVSNALPEDQALQLLNEWGPGYESETRSKIKSKLDKVSIGSLIYIAKRYGYQPKESFYKTKLGDKRVKPTRPQLKEFLLTYAQWRCNVMKNSQVEYKPFMSTNWIVLDDRKLNGIWYAIEELSNYNVSDILLNSVIDSDMLSEEYHPLKDYFENIKWDGHDRFEDLTESLIPHGNIESMGNAQIKKFYKYATGLFRLWFRAAYANAVMGKPNELMIILQGKQGIGKTRFIKRLYPTMLDMSYFFTGKIDESKDTISRLGKKFFFVDDEMEGMKKTDIAFLKQLLSQEDVTVREVYARRDKTFKRTASFMGSVNKDEFLKDEENRRFPVIAIDRVDFSKIEDIDINQLWAQAKEEYESGKFITYADDEMKALIKEFNSFHYMENDLVYYIKKYVHKPKQAFDCDDDEAQVVSLTPTEIADHIQQANYYSTNGMVRLNQKDLNRHWVKQELDRLGYEMVNHSGNKKYKVRICNLDFYKEKMQSDNFRDDRASIIERVFTARN